MEPREIPLRSKDPVAPRDSPEEPIRISDAEVDGSVRVLNSSRTTYPRLVRSRRRRYLVRHPEYFTTASRALELSDPLSYDRLVRQHQSAAEREAEGKSRGWAMTLEASLLRGEAKLAQIRERRNLVPEIPQQAPSASPLASGTGTEPATGRMASSADATAAPRIAQVSALLADDTPLDMQHLDWLVSSSDAPAAGEGKEADAKARAGAQWQVLIAERFVRGDDEDFDYTQVDDDDVLDGDDGVAGGWAERRHEEAWFDDEEECTSDRGRALEGQTGIQDF